MSEKILNTRIQLRYDSFNNWQKGNNDGVKDRGAYLKKGELAVAYVADSKTATTPNDGTHPIMFKVGPGYFNELPWASALAADVYGWAKKVRGESTDVDYTKTIKTKNEETGVETTTTSTITVQTAIDALYQAIETLSGDAGASIAELITIINKNKEDIADIVTEIGVASIDDKAATGLYAAIEAAQAAAEATAAADATSKANAAQAAAEATAAADATSKANAAQAAAEATAAAALTTARAEISAEIDADVTALETALDARLDILEGINHETFATKAEMEAETAVRVAAEAQVLADAQAYADEIKADLLGESDTLEGTYDTLKEIAGWISTHEGETVTNLTQAIADEEAARKAADDALAERIKAYEDLKSTYATKSEVEAAQSAAAADATSKANAAEAAAKAHADSVAATAKSEAISAAAADATSKADAAEAAAKAHAETKATEAKEAAIADAANKYLTEITTTENGGLTVTNKNKIDIDTTITFVFDCGDASGNPLN